MKRIKACIVGRRVMAFILCLCMVSSLISGMGLFRAVARAAETRASSGGTSGVTREADPSTMDDYTKMLDFSADTRSAGRLWTDKSVFALGDKTEGRDDDWDGKTLTLNMDDDGVSGSIALDEDFLHVFSALGSSLEITGVPPVRTVIVFDNSGSMYDQSTWEGTRIAKTVDAINAAIDELMLASQYNEVAVVLFGDGANNDFTDTDNTHPYHGQSTAVTILPMKHYQPGEKAVNDYKENNGIIDSKNNTRYLTAGWSKNQDTADGGEPNHNANNKGEGGWVFVNNDICQLKSTHQKDTDNPGHKWYTEADWKGWNGCEEKTYTAYANGTTNIQAGMYQGMQELLNAEKTETVGNQTYQCVPSLVILTDGAVTDSLNNWLAPSKDETTDILKNAMGFVCDFSYKGVSFVEHNDPRGTGGDRTNAAWNQFLAVKGNEEKGIADPKDHPSDEVEQAKGGKLYYEAVASADAEGGKLEYSGYDYNKYGSGYEYKSTTQATGKSLSAMQELANQYRDNEAYMIFTYLLTTAYYKQAVKSAYKVSDADDWSVYTITVDMPDPKAEVFKAGFAANDATKAAITSNPAMMDPGKYFNEEWLRNSGYLTNEEGNTGNTYYDDYTVGDMTVEGIQKAIKAWDTWKTGNTEFDLGTFRSIQGGWNFYDNDVKGKIKVYEDGSPVDQTADGTYDDTKFKSNFPAPNHNSFWRVYAKKELGTDYKIPTKAEATEAAKTAGFQLGELSYNYATLAYYAQVSGGSGADLANVFVDIIDAITEPLFTPVDGENDLGISDSVTYTDPVGKYMEVKDVKNLSLFGTLYDIVKTAVYDYQWNNAYMNSDQRPQDKTSNDPLPLGWYKGNVGDAGGVQYSKNLQPGMTAEQMWNAGWVYRLDYITASQFVPTLKNIKAEEDPDKTVAKQRNTVYTFYRIAEDEDARQALHMNPAYLNGRTLEKALEGITYDENGGHLNTPGVYALSDLRIWVEDTGDWNDESASGGVLGDANYDEALWVNVPVNMLPLRTMSINLGKTGEDADHWAYKTNIPAERATVKAGSAESASFPLRVFYTVGVAEDALEASRRVNIAGGISPEYIDKNKAKTAADALVRGVTQGDVEFFSNWYNPLNRYTDYATSSTDYTYGDPVVSFSPSAENRFYIFEKALPLYSTAYVWVPTNPTGDPNKEYTQSEGKWRRVAIEEEASDDAVTYLPADFGGRLLAQDLEPTEADTGDSAKQQAAIWTALENYGTPDGVKGITKAKDGDIILLKNHRLTDVTKPTDPNQTDPFKSESYFYMPIEYYTLGADGKTATPTQYVVTRKGSEFGSAYKSSGISNGDMLVWHDMSGTYPDYPYLSASDTQDPSRGKDYIGWPLKDGYYAGLTKGDKNRPYVDNDQAQAAYTDALGKLSQAEQGNYAVNWTDQRAKVMENAEKGDWVLCAKPGGLRVGDLSQAVQQKSGAYSSTEEQEQYKKYYDDRYTDSVEKRLTWGFYESNVTRTANNYYMPTISSSSDSEGGNSIIVNVYLGNNGRLRVPDTTLMVSKLVESNNPSMPIDENKEFNYQVYINGFTGPADAIVLHYNEATKSWQRQFHYIDLTLDKQLFLQTQDGQKAMVDRDGNRVITTTDGGYVYASDGEKRYDPESDGGPYYVYVGNNTRSPESIGSAATSMRVYHNDDVDGNGSVSGREIIVDGGQGEKGTFYAATVWLVSAGDYTTQWNGEVPVDPVTSELDINSRKELYTKTLSRFELLSIDPNINAETSEIAIDTPYLTSSAYWTRTVVFGQNANPNDGGPNAVGSPLTKDDLYDKIIPYADRPDLISSSLTNEGIAANTAEFTLKHGEALLFRGIPSNTVYRVTEYLTDQDVADGYNLKEVSHNQQVGSTSTYRPGVQSIPVYYNEGTTYGDIYPDGNMPDQYRNSNTQYGLTWAVKQDGVKNDESYLHDEPFFNTNAVVWEAYSTADKTAKGDNHHQPDGVPDGTSVFWLWDEATKQNINTNTASAPFGPYGTYAIMDNPNCKPLADGGCDEDIEGTNQVRHYFFKDGVLRDAHYYGEGSGYLRDFARFVTSPTVHFAVKDEPNQVNRNPAVPGNEFTSSTEYTGAYSIFGNTGTFEESANYVNTQNTDKQETHINGEEIPNTGSNMKPGVQEGDTITYSMKWGNSNENAAEVWIYDKLDPGVDFVSAKWDNYTLNAVPDVGGDHQSAQTDAKVKMTTVVQGVEQQVDVPVIRYDAENHAVTWNLGSQNASASGEVTLTVKVNKNAKQYWDYDGDGVGDAPVGDNDDLVRNRATVHVGDNQWNTNTLVNPVGGPDKNETDIEHGGDHTANPELNDKYPDGGEDAKNTVVGPLVYVGDKITYEIEWENYSDQDALITVRDPIDKNVRVLSASFDPADTKVRDEKTGEVDQDLVPSDPAYKGAQQAELNLDSPPLEGDARPASKQTDDKTVNVGTDAVPKNIPVIQYDASTSTKESEYVSEGQVTWNLGVQPAGATGKVTLVVEVLSTATPVGQVDNTSYVQVGNDRELQTKTIENPTPEVSKTETQINGEPTEPSGDDPSVYPQVKVGDKITYQIDWNQNDMSAPGEDEELTTVTVVDPLDPGVDFVSASYGEYNLEAGTGNGSKTQNFGDQVTEGVESPYYPVTIEYNADTHTVTWTLKGDPKDIGEGFVTLTVKITERALVGGTEYTDPTDDAGEWDYRDDKGLEDDGQLVQNRGAVKFKDDAYIYTDLVKNPTGPEKEEVDPGDGKQVQIGQHITYEISYQNYLEGEQQIIIRDPLDVGVDFVQAKFGAHDEGTDADWTDLGKAEAAWGGLSQDAKDALRNPETYLAGEGKTMPTIKEGIYYSVSDDTRVIYWVLEAEPDEEGRVTLEVAVNERAHEYWQYGENDTPVTDGPEDHEVVDRASIQVGNEAKVYTNIPENPVPEKTLEKIDTGDAGDHTTQPNPGDKGHGGDIDVYQSVFEGQELTYNIHWKNGTDKNADVVVTDVLDLGRVPCGVDFVSASYTIPDGETVTLDAPGRQPATSIAQGTSVSGGQPRPLVTIAFDEGTKTVTWTILNRAPGAEGDVVLTVKVNKDANVLHEVDNEARVQVGNDGQYTNIVENPTEKPGKTETDITPADGGEGTKVSPEDGNLNPGDDGKLHGPLVYVGDKITYEITWSNYESEEAIVTVRDPLDPNVEFVSAKFTPAEPKPADYKGAKEAELKDGKTESDTKVDLSKYPGGSANTPVITYDKETHTVTWNLGVQPARQKGTVTLVVKVLSSASPVGYVDNTAYVKVGDNPEQETDTIENPTPEVNKTETQINGEATEPSGSDPSLYPRVDVGDTITYKISWDRHEHPTDEELAMVTVTDPLDPGVDFVSASFRGVTLTGTGDTVSAHSNTWVVDTEGGEEPPAGQTGKGHWSITITYDKTTHTVTWTLYGDDAPEVGEVFLTVKVTTRALFDEDTGNNFNNDSQNLPGTNPGDNWEYRDNDGIEDGLTQLVQNRGAVKFGNDADIYTQLVKNPVGPEKTEVTPGDGEQVQIGDSITYEISYTNYHPAEAGKPTEQVIIRDPLDAGVDFVQAKFGNKDSGDAWVKAADAAKAWDDLATTEGMEDAQSALSAPETYIANKNMPTIPEGVYYDAEHHTVYWVLHVAAGAKGTVTLEVKVNKDAAKEWQYGTGTTPDVPVTGDGKDYEVVDRASVQVGNDSKIYTNVVENPVPDKDETKINGETTESQMKPKEGADDTEVGPTVKVGDEITYEIGFRNDRDVPVDIVIRDELDPGVDFVSASFDGVTAENAGDKLTARSKEMVTPPEGDSYWPVTVSYNPNTHTVTWTLKNMAPGQYTVTLVVKVNSKAIKSGVVDNQAEVQIGNKSVNTDIVENPTPKTEKTETSPGQGMIVKPGDEVEYAISWRNHKPDSAKVVITDCLDPGVDFRSASIEGYTGDPLTFAGPDNPTVEKSVTGSLTVGEVNIPVTIKYDPEQHAIIWTLGTDDKGSDGVPAGYEGKVTFTVAVNKKAFDKYDYNNEAKPVEGEGDDDQILNQGSVQVDNDLTYTEIVDNPLKPEKRETAIDDVEVQVGETGPKVKVGDIITYTISWMNDAREGDDPIPADVIVTDQLGTGLEFVDAGFVVFDAEGKLTYPTGKPDGYGDCTVSASGQTVTWTLPGREKNATGMVWISALVTSDAVNVVTNTGSVYDGSNTWTLPQITNPVDSGLIIEKVVENGDAGDITKQWHFTVVLTAPSGQDIPWDSITWKLVGGDSDPEVFIDAVEGTISFTLRHGEYLSLGGLPVGTHYEVVEEEANVSPYTTRVDEEHDPAVGATKDGVQTWVRFVNKRSNTPPPPPGPETVELTVDKTVVGEKGDTERLWHFTVTLDRPLTGWYGDMYFTNGVADFALKHGQSVTATGLPEGVQYTVTEAEANADGYVTDSQGASGTLNGSNYAHFINKLGDEEHDHELVVEKTVTGALGDRNREWHFRVELSQPLTGWYGNMYFANGVAEFTLKDGESRYATGLPAGVTYTVTEAEANRDGYTTETSGETGTIPDGGTAKAWFVNSKDETPSTEPDDTTPEPDNPPETPETGDNSQLGLWAMLMILSLAGVATTSFSLFGSAKWRIASFKGKHLRK